MPYFELSAKSKDGLSVTDRSVVGEEILVEGEMFFPYNAESGMPAPINNVTIEVTKPDGTVVSLNATVVDIQLDDAASPLNWTGQLDVRYYGDVDPALDTGNSLTLTASGHWTINAIWPGDSQWDRAETDALIDGRNDEVGVTVSGPSRTVAVRDPTSPDTSAAVVDMITPPMLIGSNDAGMVFGHDRALAMQVIRWSPTANTYFRYGVSGLFPALSPGDAVWIKPRNTYPAAEPLGLSAVQRGNVLTLNTVQLTQAATTGYVSGVYLDQDVTGANYFDPNLAAPEFRHGDATITLTTQLPAGTTEAWVSYVVWPLTGVDEGWIALDNPEVAREDDGGEPRYYHTNYRLVKALSRAYASQTDGSGNRILDPETRLPLLEPLSISLKTGWNQFGSIFFNWRGASQTSTPLPVGGDPALVTVAPADPSAMATVLGVYDNEDLTGTNYYIPGSAATPYRRSDTMISLTTPMPAGTTVAYIKHEVYPREDVGVPIGELTVNYLGETKTLSEAQAAGWTHDYAWRYDAEDHEYVRVHATAAGAERTLRAWSGCWIRAFVNCELVIDPNTTYNGVVQGLDAGPARAAAQDSEAGPASRAVVQEQWDMPPPAPR